MWHPKKKRRVGKHLPYNFTVKEKKALIDNWTVNWCGASKWLKFKNIMRVMRAFIEFSWKLDISKILQLYKDIISLCNWQHDIDFARWWNLKDFYKSNKKFIAWINDLLYRTYPSTRIFVKILLTIWLNSFWLIHFNFGKRKKLNLLFIH